MDQLVIHTGAPDEIGRPIREMAVYTLLDQLAIAYLRVDHSPAYTIEDCQETEKLLGTAICKNLFLRSKHGSYYLLLLPGEKRFHTKDLAAQLSCGRLSFGSPEDMEALLGLLPGAASVMGLMNDRDHRVSLVIDAPVLKEMYMGCHPCVNTSSIRIAVKDLLEKFLPYTGHVPAVVNL